MEYILSIVLPTLGRVKEVEAMLTSIFSNEVDDWITAEIIVVDQNFSDILDPVIEKYQNRRFLIHHHKVSFRGLSKAKNFGAKHANGKYVCFIDDDAEFLKNTINIAINRLQQGSYDIVSGRCVDREGNNSVLNFKEVESVLTISSFENKFIESTMFFRLEISKKFLYDENMGVGEFYGAEEGYDLMLRLLSNEVKILFDPNIKFYHPHSVISHQGAAAVRRAFTYRCGYGYLCKKNKLHLKFWKRVFMDMCYLPILAIIRPKDVRYYIAELLGLFTGRLV